MYTFSPMQSTTETLEDFYRRISGKFPEKNGIKQVPSREWGHFNVYRRDDIACRNYSPYNRRDFYKISLIIGNGTLYYADKGITIDRPALLFSNPSIPYAWEASEEEQSGYFCLFSKDFIRTVNRNESLEESPLFRIGGNPVYFLDKEQTAKAGHLFEKMLEEVGSAYIYKYDLIRNYIHLLVHQALKMQAAETYFDHVNAASRITSLFLELLERQFPVDTPEYTLRLKTAKDYALRLSVHVNHLNRAVKEVTGKTTTKHIADRIVKEAKALLRYTDWNIATIAYCLGFEYPAYFNNFFKKQTAMTPKAFRQ